MSKRTVRREIEKVVITSGEKIRQEKEVRADLLAALSKLTDSLKSLYELEGDDSKKETHHDRMLRELAEEN